MAVLEGDEILLVWLRRRRDSPMDPQLVDDGAILRVGGFDADDVLRAASERDWHVQLMPIVPGSGAEKDQIGLRDAVDDQLRPLRGLAVESERVAEPNGRGTAVAPVYAAPLQRSTGHGKLSIARTVKACMLGGNSGAARRRCRFSLQNLRRACRACVSCRSYDSTDVSIQDVPAVELEQWPQHAELFCAGGACSVHQRTIRRERQVHGEGWAGLPRQRCDGV